MLACDSSSAYCARLALQTWLLQRLASYTLHIGHNQFLEDSTVSINEWMILDIILTRSWRSIISTWIVWWCCRSLSQHCCASWSTSLLASRTQQPSFLYFGPRPFFTNWPQRISVLLLLYWPRQQQQASSSLQLSWWYPLLISFSVSLPHRIALCMNYKIDQ